MTISKRLAFQAAAALTTLLLSLPLYGEVRAAEEFNYIDGGLGDAGGFGWAGSWSSNSTVVGGAARTLGSVAFRPLEEPIVPADGVMVYVSMELGADTSQEGDFAGISFFSGDQEQLFVGMSSDTNSYGLNITGVANEGSDVPVTTERRSFIAEFLFLGPMEVTVNVYVNSGRTLGEPVATYTGPFIGGTLDQIRLASQVGVEATYDNLSIGDRLADVLGPLATDDFSYANGPLTGNGSSGWANGWTGLASVTDGTAMTAGITNSQPLWGFRTLAEPIVPEAGKTIYLGFEMEANSAAAGDFAGISFYSGDDERLFAGMAFDLDRFGLTVAGITTVGSTVAVTPGWRSVVVEIIFLSADEMTVNVYVDPWLTPFPAATYTGPFVTGGDWDRVRLASGGPPETTASFDHLVISERTFDVWGSSPTIFTGGVTHAATFLEGDIAPGQIISIFGGAMGPASQATATLDSQGRVATEAGGVRVLFDGIPGAIFYAGPRQVNVQAPYSIQPSTTTAVQVHYRGQTSQRYHANVVASNPGIFTSGGKPIVINGTRGGLVSDQAPARPGDVLVLYLTGEGETTPASVAGELAVEPYPAPVLPVTVTIGGQEAQIEYAARAPGFAGLMQVNVRVGPQTGPALPLSIQIGANASQPGVTIPVVAP